MDWWSTHVQLAAPGVVVHINGRLWPALDLGLQQDGVVFAPLPLAVCMCRCVLPHTGLAPSKALKDVLARTSLSLCSHNLTVSNLHGSASAYDQNHPPGSPDDSKSDATLSCVQPTLCQDLDVMLRVHLWHSAGESNAT